MKRIISSIMAALITASCFCGSMLSANATSEAEENAAATLSFETDASFSEFIELSADKYLSYEITDEKSYTAKGLKVIAKTGDAQPNDDYVGFQLSASYFYLPSFAGCKIEAQAYFPAGVNQYLPFFQIFSSDPSYVKGTADTLVSGKWQTVSIEIPSNTQNKFFGVRIPITSDIPDGTVVCYIDDIKIYDESGKMIASKDMDSSITSEQRAVTTLKEDPENEDPSVTDTEGTKPVVEETSSEFSLVLIVVISLFVIAIVAVIILILVSKNKNKYY